MSNGIQARHLLTAAIAVALGTAAANAGTVGGPTIISADADTGLTTTATYTHLLDFIADGSPATVNGVAFTAADRTGANYTSANISGEIPETSFNAGGAGTGATGAGLDKLLRDFYYNGVQNPNDMAENITLTGLTPGTQYLTRIFYRQWDANEANTRNTVINFNEGTGTGSITVNQDESENARMITYSYTAGPNGTLSIDFVEGNNAVPASWHHYGMSNEVIIPEPAAMSLIGLGAAGMLGWRRRRI